MIARWDVLVLLKGSVTTCTWSRGTGSLPSLKSRCRDVLAIMFELECGWRDQRGLFYFAVCVFRTSLDARFDVLELSEKGHHFLSMITGKKGPTIHGYLPKRRAPAGCFVLQRYST